MIWSVSRAPENSLKLILRNEGNAHVEVVDVALRVTRRDKPLAGEARTTYILAGQSYEWILTTAHSESTGGGRLRLKAITNAGNIETELSLDALWLEVLPYPVRVHELHEDLSHICVDRLNRRQIAAAWRR